LPHVGTSYRRAPQDSLKRSITLNRRLSPPQVCSGRKWFCSLLPAGHRGATLNFSREGAQTDLGVEFAYRLRDEMKFHSPAILKAQILEDARRALKFFRLLRLFALHRNQAAFPTLHSTL
jgi:hypothetical protein